MRLTLAIALTVPPGISYAQAAPVDMVPVFRAVLAIDQRMAAIGYRLATRNVALCRHVAPLFGWTLQTAAQFEPEDRAAAATVFGAGDGVMVELVIPNGPADASGVIAGETLIAIDGVPVPPATAGPKPDLAGRDVVLDRIARLRTDRPATITVSSGRSTREIAVTPVAGCATRFDVSLGPALTANADGSVVRIGGRFFETFDDDQMAVVIAHELAHNILEHRRRLDDAHVHYGVAASFGRNARLIRQSEDEADRLSLYLLFNAGYDPRLAVAFWRDNGSKIDGSLLRDGTHASPRRRQEAMTAELATFPAGATHPLIPAVLATRDAAFK